ncbi:STAS domain-containing protein [Pedobacter sp. SAFR-022]|uniref:STAS domain-containing protein n=1 Tax=Pedobacter sp. SAFR-022 TaxID=3436861 RepID=UPI003F7CF2F0
MALIVDKHEKYVVVKLNEETFTNDNAPLLKSEFILLNSQGYRNIIMDLSMVKDCEDSQDLSCLLVGDRLCKKSNGHFLITGVNDSLEKIIEISGLDESLNFVAKLREAEDLIFMEEVEKDLLGGGAGDEDDEDDLDEEVK